MKKFLLILLMGGLIFCLLVGCSGVTPPPGEGEGEGEGEEEVSRVVIVELFSQDGCSSCTVVEPIIEQLAEEYERSEVVFLEERAYGSYSLDEIRDRYNWYIPDEEDRGTPNILFDGLNIKLIYGASTYGTIKSKISTELAKDAKIKIIVVRNSDSDTTTITGTIENISTSTLSNLVINGMNFKDRGQVGTKYSVLDIFVNNPTEITVSTLAPNEKRDFSFVLENINWDGNKMHGVIFVQAPNSNKKEILQAMYVE